jgi:hypothetical protein
VHALCAAAFTCSSLVVQTRCSAALIALTCNCHEPPTNDVRQTELGRPHSARDSPRGRDWYNPATVVLSFAGMPLQLARLCVPVAVHLSC